MCNFTVNLKIDKSSGNKHRQIYKGKKEYALLLLPVVKKQFSYESNTSSNGYLILQPSGRCIAILGLYDEAVISSGPKLMVE